MAVDRITARQRVTIFGSITTEPVVTDPQELEFLLDMGRVMDLNGAPPPRGWSWYSNISLRLGTFVAPSVPNGHFYKVTAGSGAAGTTEPTWPTGSGTTVALAGLTYTEQGARDWTETYDANYVIAQCWLLKAGRVAERYNFMVAGKMFSRQQYYDHCMKQYRVFAGKAQLKAARLATPLIGESLSNIPLWNEVQNNDGEG